MDDMVYYEGACQRLWFADSMPHDVINNTEWIIGRAYKLYWNGIHDGVTYAILCRITDDSGDTVLTFGFFDGEMIEYVNFLPDEIKIELLP